MKTVTERVAELRARRAALGLVRLEVYVRPQDRERIKAAASLEAITHGEGCWAWGPQHYYCALDEIQRLRDAT